MKANVIIFSILASISLLGCGGSTTESTSKVNITDSKELDIAEGNILALSDSELPLIEGTWVQSCVIDGDRSFKSHLVYDESNIKIQINTYSDSLCQDIFFRSKVYARFTFGEIAETLLGETVNNINYAVDSASVSFYDEDVISDFNKENLCDARNWQSALTKDVSNCDAFKSLWSIEKDILMLEGEELKIGDLGTLGAEGFPSQLNENIFLRQDDGTLQGDWVKGCTAENENSAYTQSISFSTGGYIANSEGFEDSNCEVLQYKITNSGTYVVGPEKTLASGEVVSSLVIESTSSRIAYYSPFIIDYLNRSYPCGSEDWAVGEFKEVVGCEAFTVDEEAESIFYIDEDKLFLGTQEEGEASDQLSSSFYIRQ